MEKKKRINWIANTFSIIVITALILGIYFPLVYIDDSSHEPRSKVMIALDNGALFWGILTLVFLLGSIALFVRKRYIKSLIALVILLCNASLLFVAVANLQPYHKDIAIFQNKHNHQDKLIIQYYEIGITGNLHRRMIKTKNMESAIRDIETIPVPALIDTLSYWNIKEKMPMMYVDKKDTFLLKEVSSLYDEKSFLQY